MEEFNRQELLKKFNKVLDKAEEIINSDEYKEFCHADEECQKRGMSYKERFDLLGPNMRKIREKYYGKLAWLALDIAYTGNNWLD